MIEEPLFMKQQLTEEDKFERLEFVYHDLGTRLKNDDNTSWRIILLSGILLGLLGTIVKLSGSLNTFQLVLTIISIVLLLGTIGCAFVSLLIFRDLRHISNMTYLLGKDGEKAYKNNEYLVRKFSQDNNKSRYSVFHTVDFLSRGVQQEDRNKYQEDIASNFITDLVDYIFFLANLIEVRKRPRSVALWMVLFDSIFITLTAIFVSC
jgi:hypothetical protein